MSDSPKLTNVGVKLLEDATLAGLQTKVDAFLNDPAAATPAVSAEARIYGPVVIVDVGGNYVATVNFIE